MKLNDIPPAIVNALGEVLRKNGYFQENTEQLLQYKFGTWLTSFAPTVLFPLFDAMLSQDRTPISILLSWLYCCQPVFIPQLKSVLGERLYEDLCKYELILPAVGVPEKVESAIQIIPFIEQLFVATEKPKKVQDARGSFQCLSFDSNAVMTLFPDSYDLANQIRGTRGETALDLCCGNGAQSLVLAKNKNVGHVVGMDVNERALDYARFNAKLNGLNNIVFQHHDIRMPIVESARFEIVVANPPFCPTVRQTGAAGSAALFCDGGACGDDFVRIILHERMKEVILDKGRTFIIAPFVLRQGERVEERLKSFSTEELSYNTAVIDLGAPSSAEAPILNPFCANMVYFIASQTLTNPTEYPGKIKEFYEHLHGNGITGVKYVVLKLDNFELKHEHVSSLTPSTNPSTQ